MRGTMLASGWSELVARPKGQLAALDGLRTLAVLLVVGDHFLVTVWRDAKLGDAWWMHTPLLRYGWSGVDLFFVLSGFLIGGQLWRERARFGTINFPRFFTRRALRIWPLYFVTLVLMSLGAGRNLPHWPDWLLVSNYFPTPYARSWSLSTEEMFYLSVPVLVMLLPRLRVRSIAAGLIALLIAADVNRVLAFAQLREAGLPSQQIALNLYSPFHTHNEGLLIGLLLALVATHLPDAVRPSTGRAPSLRGLAVLTASLGIAATVRITGGQALSFTGLAVIYGGLTYFVLVDRSVLSAPFRWRVCFPLARLSYGMYLNHLVFGVTLIVACLEVPVARSLPTAAVFASGLLLTILVSILFATGTFLLVEHPSLLLRRRIVARWAPAAHAGESALIPSAGPAGNPSTAGAAVIAGPVIERDYLST